MNYEVCRVGAAVRGLLLSPAPGDVGYTGALGVPARQFRLTRAADESDDIGPASAAVVSVSSQAVRPMRPTPRGVQVYDVRGVSGDTPGALPRPDQHAPALSDGRRHRL